MAIGAVLRLLRIVERSRALAGDAAGLPVVVVVEAALPAVAVHRNVEMDFVAGGAELGRIFAHERLHERAAVGLRGGIREGGGPAPDPATLSPRPLMHRPD